VGKNMAFCCNCGEDIQNAQFCSHCGTKAGAAASVPQSTIQVQPVVIQQPVQQPQQQYHRVPKSRVAYILFALFFGSLGVHNFYAGYTGRGIAQLLITLFLSWWLIIPIFIIWIWNLVEMIAVDTDCFSIRMN